ncbi:hypothetical protein MPTK1_6g10470 [Marchantia polymorpha subsp. ruderalis]|uniref:Uncharacterized protein n=2 Tax=Marchantia polymorpha TaxID=3197 RepID=A0AAF6BQL3_MARPO|nr:hypothetical protein MARPO_0016s0088 [Marchantia polymorpha]BBN14297.1 hypothetical protein Mp_6g10470 [Marchantia polymorpha subsp. ruderalis]|eukprot:PTQ45030.1 hypothetical protein MARPO_0016s0088 [Marchantia polymorpha]
MPCSTASALYFLEITSSLIFSSHLLFLRIALMRLSTGHLGVHRSCAFTAASTSLSEGSEESNNKN